MKEYDLIVIGAGSGGLVAATTAHRKGLKTAMIEKNKIGGECTHYGCVPSKALINAAKAQHSLHKMKDLGISVEVPPVDFKKIMEQVNAIVQGIYAHETPDIFQNQGIDVFVDHGGAQFTDAHTIKIGKETLQGKNIIICTGSSPRKPEIKGIDKARILHNENFWTLRTNPGKIVFIGGGVISVELGQALVRLGCEVTILERNDRILAVTDPTVGSYLTQQIEQEGVQVFTNTNTIEFVDENTLTVSIGGVEKNIKGDYFFIASGRLANTSGMYLENAGVDYNNRGIPTNEYLQTSVPHIYACGDVTTRYKFTHTASHQANICIENILTDNTKTNDLSVLPWGIFTEPEIGHVGLSVVEATEKFGADQIHVFKVEAGIDRFITDRKTGGFLQVIFDANDYIVGAEAVGQHAGEWIQLLTIAIKNNISAQQMNDTIFPYPTYSEIVKKAMSRYLRTK